MTQFRVLVHKSSTGLPLAEVPLNGLSYNLALSGAGALSGTLPVAHPLCTEVIFGQRHGDPDRELTVFRDDRVEINCPLTGTSATLLGDTLQVNAREAAWYLLKRTCEETKDYTGWDVDDAVDDLLTSMVTKESTGDDHGTLPAGSDIIADLPRFSWDLSGLSGTVTTAVFAAAGRHTYQQLLEFLAADPESGFEWRMDYHTSSTRQQPQRTMVFGSPSVGQTRTFELTQRVLSDYGRDTDWEDAATRVHVFYDGGVVTRQSAVAASNNVILLEKVESYSDVAGEDLALARAKDIRRLSKPGIRIPTASWRPSPSLPFDALDVGDVVPFETTWPDILSITADTRRVIDVKVDVGDDGDELRTATFNDLLDDLGD